MPPNTPSHVLANTSWDVLLKDISAYAAHTVLVSGAVRWEAGVVFWRKVPVVTFAQWILTHYCAVLGWPS